MSIESKIAAEEVGDMLYNFNLSKYLDAETLSRQLVGGVGLPIKPLKKKGKR